MSRIAATLVNILYGSYDNAGDKAWLYVHLADELWRNLQVTAKTGSACSAKNSGIVGSFEWC